MRRCLFPLLLLCLPLPALAEAVTNVYVCAHPDDCVLFMNPDLYDDAKEATDNTAIIYLTSGDAGEPFRADKSSYPFTRELASKNTTDWMRDSNQPEPVAVEKNETITLNGHAIARASYDNVASYFLRLPDGNMYGGGFERYDFQSLLKLHQGEIKKLSSIDGKNTYAGWQDLVNTLGAIVAHESKATKRTHVHLADTNTEENVGDHSDHIVAATAMLDALSDRTEHADDAGRCYTLFKHIGYAIADMETNLDYGELENKSGSFAALTAIQQSMSGKHNWDEAHTRYLARNYLKIESMPKGCAVGE